MSTSKRKASTSNGSSREEKRSKKAATEEVESTGANASAKRLPNGARHQDAEEKAEDEEGDVTPRLTATAQNGKASSPSPPNKAKGKKSGEVAAGGKVGSKTASSSKKSKKKKQKRSGTVENEDDEDAAPRSDAEEVSTSKNPRKVAGAAIASNSAQPAAPPLTGKAKGKEIANDDITTLAGHSAEVFSSAWNSTVPGLIASAGGDATVRIWDLPAKGASPDAPAICKHLPTTHAKDVSALEWNPDGTLLASGSYDGILRLWTPQGDLHLVMSMHQGPIFSVKWNRKGTMLLTSSADGTAIVWDLSSGKVRQQFPVHSDGVLDVDWLVNSRSQGPSSTRNDMTFATASADNSINLCRVGETKPIRTLRGHDDEVNALRFDASQTLLASASDDKTTRIWSIDGNVLGDSSSEPSSRPKRGSAGLSKGRGGSVALDASASMDVDNRSDEDDTAAEMRVGSTSNSGSLDKNGKAICQFVLTGHTKEIYNLQWAPTGPGTSQPSQPRMLATASFDKTARIWNAEDGTCLRVIEEHSDCVYSVCWSPDARFLATGSIDRKVLVNRVKDGEIVKAYVAGGPVFDVTWHVSQSNASSSGVAAIKGEAAAEEGEGSEAAKRAKSGGAAAAKDSAAASSPNGSASGGTHQLGISQADKRLTILDLGRLEEEEEEGGKGGEQATQGDKTKMEE